MARNQLSPSGLPHLDPIVDLHQQGILKDLDLRSDFLFPAGRSEKEMRVGRGGPRRAHYRGRE